VTSPANDERTKSQRRIVREPCARAVAMAARVAGELALETLDDIDVVLIGAHYGLTPVVRDLENEEAHLVRAGSRGLVCIARRVWETGAWRFAYAHEIGHWLLDDANAHDDLARLTSKRPTSARRGVESAASDFAGLLVVPPRVGARWDLGAPGLGTVGTIARACGVSVQVAALRVLQMTRAPRAVAVSVAGRVEWWAETAAFGARVRAGRAVPEGSAAAKLHDARCEGVADSWDAGRVAGSAVRVEGGDVVVSWLG
jgi:hypothetical protein